MTVNETDREQVREGRRPSEFIKIDLMRALSDERRVRIWAYLCEHTAGAPEIGKAIGESQNVVRFHLSELEAGEWIEPVVPGSRPRRYQVTRALLPPDTWDLLPKEMRQHVGVRMLRMLYTDAGESIEVGRFFRPGHHLSLTPMVVDAEGQDDVKGVMEEVADRLIAIQGESNERMRSEGRSDGDGVSLTVALASFEALRDPADGLKASRTVRL